jgi:hypothetical protein
MWAGSVLGAFCASGFRVQLISNMTPIPHNLWSGKPILARVRSSQRRSRGQTKALNAFSFTTRTLLTGYVVVFATQHASAALITAFDFEDGRWQTTLSESGTAMNESTVSAGSISVAKGSGSGGSRIDVRLRMGESISTVGFELISLRFQAIALGTLEWNGDLTTSVASTDGIRFFGSGLEINANAINDLTGTAAELEFASDGLHPNAFPSANFQSGFQFHGETGNSAIHDLTFRLQVNARSEQVTISNVQLHGTPIESVSEPRSLVSLAGMSMILLWRNRLRRSASRQCSLDPCEPEPNEKS